MCEKMMKKWKMCEKKYEKNENEKTKKCV